jgi:hypothetical protein
MTRARTLSRLANATVLTVDGSNNVGINSTIPDAKLDVIGIVSATSFYGDGSNLSNVISGIGLSYDGNSVGTAITQINFSGFGSVTAPASGFSTVTVDRFLTIGVRVGSAVTFSISGGSFNVIAKGGGNIPITV